jgi:pseudaminic acid cytidylyltransferase
MIDPSTLVILPARGGSKRIPKKNIKKICGQPMIYWPLRELSKLFSSSQILVSTDDQEIIQAVSDKGLKVPFIRPKTLSDDFTGTMDVATHALDWYEKNVAAVDYVLMVYPTAVLLNVDDIRSAYRTLMNDTECGSVFSATNFVFPIQRAFYQNSDGYAAMFHPDNYSKRSQDLTEAFHDAGQFYLCRSKTVRLSLNLFNSKSKAQILHRNKVIDIDTVEDFEVAEQKMKIHTLTESDSSWIFD